MDYFTNNQLKNLTWELEKDQSINNLEDLKLNFERAVDQMKKEDLDKAIDDFHVRIKMVELKKGEKFENESYKLRKLI